MNWMLDLIRSRPWARQNPARAAGHPSRRRSRLAVESLEGRRLLSLSSFFAGLFPTFSSTNTTNATNKQILKLLRQPPDVSYPPYNIKFEVDPESDPGRTGQVFNSNIILDGVAPAFSTVWIAYGPLGYFTNITRADSAGYFSYPATVPPGTTLIRAFSENLGDDYSSIASIHVNNADPIVSWDALALTAISKSHLTAEEASRDLAILHTAQYDAVVAATKPGAAYAVTSVAKAGASPVEAANAAGESVLLALFPALTSTFTAAFTAAAAGETLTPAILNGAALGADVAQKTLATRSNDGSALTTSTGLIFNPNWSQVRPFVLTGASEFRPAAPPAVGTTAFDQALSEVTALGRSISATRTIDQTTAAEFWDDPAGTPTNAGHWNEIAEQVALTAKTSLLTNARAFAMLDLALADSSIASADAKFAYLEPRPITPIQTIDPTWTPLLATPATPSYVSEHAAIGAAASDVLSKVYGKAVKFTAASMSTTSTTTRNFASFAAAATEDATSRVYGGVNYRFDTTAGANVGHSVAQTVLARFPSAK